MIALLTLGLDDEPQDEYTARCPACGDPIDYCTGHGMIGDPVGWEVLVMHDEGEHAGCASDGCAEKRALLGIE